MMRYHPRIALLASISLLMLLLLPWQPVLGQAQHTVRLSAAVVNLWPEHDRPSMLVIYEIDLAEDTPLPQDLVFQIPEDAELVTVSGRNPGGRLVVLDHTVTTIGDWQDVTFATDSLEIQMEYYDPNLIKQEEIRLFEFQWLSIYPVDLLQLIVRQPFGASEIQGEPSLGERIAGRSGMQYYLVEAGAVPAGELFTLSLRYIKNTANLSYPALEVLPLTPINADTPGRTPSPMQVVLWLVAVALAVLIMVGLYYWWFRVNITQKSDRITQGIGFTNPEKQAVFCHECGTRSKAGDSYCRNCGTELRQPTDLEKAYQD